MKINIEYLQPAATAGQLAALENRLSIRFPDGAGEILRTLAGARFADNVHSRHGEVSIVKFCPLSSGEDSIEQTYERYSGRVPDNWVPVAIAEGGNLLLVALENGQVFFWDHELEDYDESSDGSEACVKLADSLGEFLDDLKPTGNTLPNAKVVYVKIDPAFAAKFGLKLPK